MADRPIRSKVTVSGETRQNVCQNTKFQDLIKVTNSREMTFVGRITH